MYCADPSLAFAFVIGAINDYCDQGTGYFAFDENGNDDTANYMFNQSGYRVWFHLGDGGSVCYSNNYLYNIASSDAQPLTIQISTNSNLCDDGPSALCGGFPMVGALGPNNPAQCFLHNSIYDGAELVLPWWYMTNGTGYRVWLHQDADGSGWADCFNHGNAFIVYSTRDANPGNLDTTSTDGSSC